MVVRAVAGVAFGTLVRVTLHGARWKRGNLSQGLVSSLQFIISYSQKVVDGMLWGKKRLSADSGLVS